MTELERRTGGWDDAVRTRKFWMRVLRTDNCWLWTGSVTCDGYGRVSWNRKPLLVHRVAWELSRGPIPGDRVIDHICRIRNCVNPDHLRLVTIAENVLVGIGSTAINARKTQCKSGHPFDAANTYIDKTGHRNCRACRAARERERRAAHGK